MASEQDLFNNTYTETEIRELPIEVFMLLSAAITRGEYEYDLLGHTLRKVTR